MRLTKCIRLDRRAESKTYFVTFSNNRTLRAGKSMPCRQKRHSRDELVTPPSTGSQDRALMRSPDGDWPLDDEAPDDDPSVRVPGHEATIGAYEGRCVNL
jgi:hypothetical protein